MLSKYLNDKKYAPKLIFFNEKKLRKILIFLKYQIDFESQTLALFNTSPLHQFPKFNNFLWVCCFLAKILSDFVHPAWKLHNRYCHKCAFFVLSVLPTFDFGDSQIQRCSRSQYVYQESILLASLMQWYAKVHLFPSWLVWSRNQVYCACCSARSDQIKMDHKS